MTELSDAEVFGSSADHAGELSDDQVFGSSSAAGAFYRGAKGSALPAAGGLAAAGAGAALGEMAAPLAGPAAPAAAIAFPIIGAVVGGFAGGAAIKKAQDMIADVFGLGESDAQAQADAVQHPVASFMGELAPNIAAFRPQSGLMIAGRIFGAGLQGGIEAGQEYATDGKVDPVKTGIATAFGAVFTKSTALGESIMNLGGRQARRLDGLTNPRPDVVPSPIAPIQDSPSPPMARSDAARTAIPEVDAVLNSPTTKAAIDNAVIDRSRDVPYMAGGSTPLQDPTVYIDRHVPKEQSAPSLSDPAKSITFDPAEPWTVHENVEQHTMEMLIKGGMAPEEAYRVAHFEFAEPAEQAWYRAHDIDQAVAEKEQLSWLPKIQHENPENPPPNLYDKPYPHANVRDAQHESVEEAKPSPEEVAKAMDIIRNAPDLQPKPDPVAQAQQLGVIGPRAPEHVNPEVAAKDTPAEAAFRAIPPQPLGAQVTPSEMIDRAGHAPGSYDERGKEWIDKIDDTDSARASIEQLARQYDFFPESRGGTPSPAARAAVAEAAGIDPSEIDSSHFAEHFDNDGSVRAVIQALRQTTRDFMEASDKARREPTDENAAAAFEAQERQRHVLEYTLGKRAESGRSLNAWKELLRETERSKATVELKKGEQPTGVEGKQQPGAVPKGTSDLVDAANEVQSNLKKAAAGEKVDGTLGLQKLIDAAEKLVGAPAAVAKPRTELPPELADLVGEAKKVLSGLKAKPEEKSGLQKLVDSAEKLVGSASKEGSTAQPLPPELAGLVDEAKKALNGLKATPEEKSGLQRLVDSAQKLVGAPAKEAKPQAELTPALAGLVDEAKKALSGLKAKAAQERPQKPQKGEAELAEFRQRLTDLSQGNGSVLDTAAAAKKLVAATAKEEKPGAEPQDAEAKAAARARTKLLGAAQKLADADKQAAPKEPAPSDPELAPLLDSARVATGLLKEGTVRAEAGAFRDALAKFRNGGEGSEDEVRSASKALLDALGKTDRKAIEPRALVELDKVTSLARRFAENAGKSPKETLPPDLRELVDNSREAVAAIDKNEKTGLDRLVAAAEKQAVDMVKQKAVRKPADALPPELQALVDKSERVVDRFGGIAKGEKAALLLARAGRTAAEQADLARQVEGLTPNQVARVLSKLRDNPGPGWVFWTVQQGLISGLITHSKYALVNTAQTFSDRVIAPEIAAIMGRLRGGNDSLLAPLQAGIEIFKAVPDALAGVKQAFKTGTRVPLESEIKLAERGEANPEAAGALVPYAPRGANWGVWKKVFNDNQLASAEKVIGVPGRSANSIHTFFKILNERAAGGQRAFETAVAEGEKPGTDSFKSRYDYHLDNPTDAALKQNVEDAYAGTFMEKLGEQTEKFASVVRNTPVKWLIFFTHIPMNMARRSVEYSPLALLNTLGETKMGSAIKGELGSKAQNLAFSKMAVGTAVGAYFINQSLSGNATGDYPTDPKERARWAIEGIQPNSIKADGQWISMERLGPQATVARIAANYASIIKNYDGSQDESLMKAGLAFALGTAGALADDVGFETIRNIVNVLENPKEAARFAAWQLSSYAMPVSLITQFASAADPYMRQADTLLNGLKYHMPLLRETLLPKRDPIFGEPVPNPGYHNILRKAPVNTDPVKEEMDNLRYYPTAPEKKIAGIQLSPELYDRYQVMAGSMAKSTLEGFVGHQNWGQMPPQARIGIMKAAISEARKVAQSMILGDTSNGVLQQAIKAKTDALSQ